MRAEIYSTGRANLPKSVAQRDLLQSFSRMLPELLRFSSASHLLEQIPEALQAHHRLRDEGSDASDATAGVAAPRRPSTDLWSGWSSLGGDTDLAPFLGDDDDDEEGDVDLTEFGF